MIVYMKTNVDSLELTENRCLSAKKTADYLGVSPRTLSNWRHRGIGPKYVRTGAVKSPVLYRVRDIDEWIEAREAVTERCVASTERREVKR